MNDSKTAWQLLFCCTSHALVLVNMAVFKLLRRKVMKRFLGLAAMALSVFSAASLPSNADATCTANQALPVRVTLSTSNNLCYIHFRPALTTYPALVSNYWYGYVSTTTTTGAAMCEMATDAVTNQTRVMITSNATACPAATANAANIGTIYYLSVNP